MRELLDAKPGLVWGLGGAAVAECGQKWLSEHAAFLEQSLTLYADSPLWSWSDLGEGLEKLSKVARDLLAEEEAFLGMMQAALNPATVREEVGLEEHETTPAVARLGTVTLYSLVHNTWAGSASQPWA